MARENRLLMIYANYFPIPINLPQLQRKLRHLRHSRPLVEVLHRHIRRHGIAALGKDRIHQRTGMTQVSQFALQLERVDGNWKITA